ncbi:MAG: helicase-exonuclease AddAB subunit AddA [Eubacteriales bacterium]|nr:helicase-exonuclease AddAB subunit AddA [Eubacteriales bacterium]
MNFTKEQAEAIFTRGEDILVSAGAGAGKTRVLVTRISEMICDEKNPISADQFLVLTFTNAAAKEMKERITTELEKRLQENPDNRMLRRQIRVVKHADISTIHSFCTRLIRTHFNELGLDPAFRIGEKGELTIMKQETMNELLEARYLEASDSFVQFVEAYAPGKDDGSLEKMIEKLYDFSTGFADRDGWFAGADEIFAHTYSEEGMESSDVVKKIMKQAIGQVENFKRMTVQALACFDETKEPANYYALIENTDRILNQLLEEPGYGHFYEILHELSFANLPRPNKAAKEWPYLEKVKTIYTQIRKDLGDLRDQHFLKSLSQMRREQENLYPFFKEFLSLAKDFSDLYSKKKREKNVFDFDDLEFYALKLLVASYDENGKAIPSDYAREIAGRYHAIFVDEYQDTNMVQETIITTLQASGDSKLFVVGDVKQSIYRFRQARPDLFLDRYRRYETGEGLKIELRDNFRSSPDVLDFCNQFFQRFMTVDFGGLDYNEKVALRAGKNGPMEDIHAEQEALIYLMDGELDEDVDKILGEAAMIGEKIKSLHEEGYDYKEMVILLRSVKNYDEPIADYLASIDIPVICESQTGYFQSREIQIMLNYLSLIDNVYQDIPMASVLLSGIGGFTSEDLARIKIMVDASMRGEFSLYELMKLYTEEGKDSVLQDKIKQFLQQLEYFRQKKQEMVLHELLWEIYQKTGFYEEVLTMSRAEKRRENLMMLMKKAEEYEKTMFKGLFYFIRYMEQLRSYEVEFAGASVADSVENAVRIMTTHKSKGLEYPVVFVSGLAKQFNKKDLNDSVLCHPSLGIGMDQIDLNERVKSPSVLKRVIKDQMLKETLEEELRILYVAMTRAQKKIILTGISNEKTLQSVTEFGENIRPEDAKCMLDWVLPVLYQDGNWNSTTFFHDWEIQEILSEREEMDQGNSLEVLRKDSRVTQARKDVVEKAFSYEYPYKDAITMKRKASVSELKKLAMKESPGDEVRFAEDLVEEEIPKPAFMEEKEEELSSTAYGTMVHKIMELLDFSSISSKKDLFDALSPLYEQLPQITEGQKKKIYKGAEAFLFSDYGQEVIAMDCKKHLYKEKPFTLGVDQNGEIVVIQGIIDLCGEKDSGIWLLDYKTDRVEEGKESILLDRYKTQMLYYKLALEQIMGKDVTKTLIYSFSLQKFIEICWEES